MNDALNQPDYRAQPAVLLIGEAAGHIREGQEALLLAGARMIGPVSLSDATTALTQGPVIDGVLIEAGSAGQALGGALDAVAAWRSINGASVVIALDDSQIDEVTACLFDGNVQLLCAPSIAERVAALVIAFAHDGGGRLRQGNDDRDRDSERLSKLNAEVARIAETLSRLTRADQGGLRSSMLGDRAVAYRGPDDGDDVPVTAAQIRQVIRGRRLRDQFFGEGLFEDPAWDMLLDLCAADLERARVSVSSLCIAAAVAPTTALRWISRMTEAGLFEREADPFDRRRAYMQLSSKARDGMHQYWRAAKRIGAIIA